MHLKVFCETEKNPKNPLVWTKNPKKPKKPTGLGLKINRVFSNSAMNREGIGLSYRPPAHIYLAGWNDNPISSQFLSPHRLF
jgi:hypothetical protein